MAQQQQQQNEQRNNKSEEDEEAAEGEAAAETCSANYYFCQGQGMLQIRGSSRGRYSAGRGSGREGGREARESVPAAAADSVFCCSSFFHINNLKAALSWRHTHPSQTCLPLLPTPLSAPAPSLLSAPLCSCLSPPHTLSLAALAFIIMLPRPVSHMGKRHSSFGSWQRRLPPLFLHSALFPCACSCSLLLVVAGCLSCHRIASVKKFQRASSCVNKRQQRGAEREREGSGRAGVGTLNASLGFRSAVLITADSFLLLASLPWRTPRDV